MDLDILAEFVSLVETCSFQETAAQRNISQSALSKHIHKLEEELELTLFDRSQRSIRPNQYGTRLYPYARHMIQIHTDAMASLKELGSREKKQFTIAYNPILGQYGIVDLVTDFVTRYPNHQMLTVEDYHCLELLKNQECDFAFVDETDTQDSNFSQMIFKTDRLSVVVREDHPLAEQPTVSLPQLKDERFILHAGHAEDITHSETRKFLELCASNHFSPNIVAESQFTSTILRYVSSGRGIAVLNRLHIPQEYENLRIIDFYPTVYSYIYLLYPRKIVLPSALDFLHYMVDHCGD